MRHFEQSHLLNKLRKIIAVARVTEGQQEVRSLVHSVALFDLDNPFIYSQVSEFFRRSPLYGVDLDIERSSK